LHPRLILHIHITLLRILRHMPHLGPFTTQQAFAGLGFDGAAERARPKSVHLEAFVAGADELKAVHCVHCCFLVVANDGAERGGERGRAEGVGARLRGHHASDVELSRSAAFRELLHELIARRVARFGRVDERGFEPEAPRMLVHGRVVGWEL